MTCLITAFVYLNKDVTNTWDTRYSQRLPYCQKKKKNPSWVYLVFLVFKFSLFWILAIFLNTFPFANI